MDQFDREDSTFWDWPQEKTLTGTSCTSLHRARSSTALISPSRRGDWPAGNRRRPAVPAQKGVRIPSLWPIGAARHAAWQPRLAALAIPARSGRTIPIGQHIGRWVCPDPDAGLKAAFANTSPSVPQTGQAAQDTQSANDQKKRNDCLAWGSLERCSVVPRCVSRPVSEEF